MIILVLCLIWIDTTNGFLRQHVDENTQFKGKNKQDVIIKITLVLEINLMSTIRLSVCFETNIFLTIFTLLQSFKYNLTVCIAVQTTKP